MAKKQILTSALGIAEPYAYLNKPDYGNEERGFGNPRGVYKVDLTVDNKDPRCQSMIDQIVSCHEAAYAAAKEEYEANPPQVARGKKPLLPYEGDLPFFDNGDGTTTFKLKCYASFQDKKTKETKGLWEADDRKKHLLIREQYPMLDIRLVFSSSRSKIYKGSPTSYGEWCEKHSILFADKLIPLEWLKEPKREVPFEKLKGKGDKK